MMHRRKIFCARVHIRMPHFRNSKDVSWWYAADIRRDNKLYLLIQFLLKRETNKDPSAKRKATKISEKIISIWDNTSIPTILEEGILKKLLKYRTSYKNILKSTHCKNAEKLNNFLMLPAADSKWIRNRAAISLRMFPIRRLNFWKISATKEKWKLVLSTKHLVEN